MFPNSRKACKYKTRFVCHSLLVGHQRLADVLPTADVLTSRTLRGTGTHQPPTPAVSFESGPCWTFAPDNISRHFFLHWA